MEVRLAGCEAAFTQRRLERFRAASRCRRTIDNFSLDTMLTSPSTPQYEDSERMRDMKSDMQDKLDKQKEEFQAKLKADEEAKVELETLRAAKEEMEAKLKTQKETASCQNNANPLRNS